MGFKVKGLDKLQKDLDKMAKSAQQLEKNNSVPLTDLFNGSFMARYTEFKSFDEFLESGNFQVNSQSDFDAIPDEDMDIHVKASTHFSKWEDMFSKATEIYITKKLGL
ncbi:hypothetical protein [Clostridium intestinale]|uniref:Uncharacterized protein n=1 Tax=Clostridium intestinale TaxID=36845 RepID=A0A7D6VQ85_9CLOT|nr:hypothetical protein [Clostridium intestinale]QLY79189.1 hypothetical protein HZF06_19240 [Clostridium intestinale]